MHKDALLLGSLYDTIDDVYVPEFLELLSAEYQVRNAGYCSWRGGISNCEYHHSDMPRSTVEAYLEFIDEDPWVVAESHRPKKTSAYRGTDLIPQKQLRNTRMYVDLMAPSDLDYMLCCTTPTSNDFGSFLVLHNTKKQGDFDKDTKRNLEHLCRHLERVAQVKATRHHFSHFDFDRCGPCLEMDRVGVRAVNEAFQELTRTGLAKVVGKRVKFSDVGFQLRFAERVEARLSGTVEFLSISRFLSSASGSLSAYIVADETRGRPTLFVFLQAGWAHYDFFRQAFALTEAEARLGDALLRGITLKDYAIESGRSLNTVRSQCKSVLAKTQCSSQQELIRKAILR